VDVTLILFLHGEENAIGGMEEHGLAMAKWVNKKGIKNAIVHTLFDENGRVIFHVNGQQRLSLRELKSQIDATILFHNSGHLIEHFKELKAAFPNAIQVYRTGGNEVLQASLQANIEQHGLRQKFWVNSINESVDILVTNSAFTERRYRDLGISPRIFLRAVGGTSKPIPSTRKTNPNIGLNLFCAARFVAYKNHFKLIDLVKDLIQNGLNVKLRLAGDGPLFEQVKDYVSEHGLDRNIQFLGAITPDQVSTIISDSDVYVQMSIDEERLVQGGSYIHTEGMGRSILAAIGSGTWIIAGNAGAIPEIVHGTRGVIVDPNHVEEARIALFDWINVGCPKPSPTNEYCWDNYFQKYNTFLGDQK